MWLMGVCWRPITAGNFKQAVLTAMPSSATCLVYTDTTMQYNTVSASIFLSIFFPLLTGIFMNKVNINTAIVWRNNGVSVCLIHKELDMFLSYLSATKPGLLTFSAVHILQLQTIQVVTPTYLTTSANCTCGLSVGTKTNILLVFWPIF